MSTTLAMLIAIPVLAGVGWLLDHAARFLWHLVRG